MKPVLQVERAQALPRNDRSLFGLYRACLAKEVARDALSRKATFSDQEQRAIECTPLASSTRAVAVRVSIKRNCGILPPCLSAKRVIHTLVADRTRELASSKGRTEQLG